MIYDRQSPIPGAVLREASPPELAGCPRCDGHLVARTLTVWEAAFPGKTIVQCDRCRLIETPEMRRAAQATLPVPRKKHGDRPVPEHRLVCQWRACAKPFISAKPGRKFCSRTCGNEWRLAEGLYRPHAIRRMTVGRSAA